ncbi:MAG: hypothetical protein U0237_15900 [Thermoleophilia bacterium]
MRFPTGVTLWGRSLPVVVQIAVVLAFAVAFAVTRHGARAHRMSLPPGRWLARAALTLGALFLAVHILLPLAGGLSRTASAVARASWWLLPLALLLEAASLASYARSCSSRSCGRPAPGPQGLILRSAVAATALAKTMPGGSSAARIVLTVELLGGRNGLGRAQAVSGVAATGAISWAVLALTVPLASWLAILAGAAGGVALGSAVLTLAILAAAALAPLGLRRRARRRRPGRGAVLRGPLRRLADPAVLGAAVTEAIRAAQEVVRRPRAWPSPRGGPRPTGCWTSPCWSQRAR